ncbi:G2/mitotic-specific cyclin [Tulasnella sp. 419]|nr:G2/mitotic-specific cyclin [Tulasnella sp. 418]KAG8970740.1 G2/mitotic-specific cyclin [Tulasnella sp. 419]
MSTTVPTRRTRNPLRPSVDENATRTTRIAGKSTKAAGTNDVLEKPTVTATRADQIAAAKRKREALGEVTNKNKLRQQPGGSSKQGLEKESVVLAVKKSVSTTLTSTTTGIRAPLADRRVVPQVVIPARKTRSSATDKEITQKDAAADDAMAVDEERPQIRASRRISTRTSTTTTHVPPATRRSLAVGATAATSSAVAGRRVPSTAGAASQASATARSRAQTRRPLATTQVRARVHEDQVEDVVKPAHKKRRTSSVPPEEKPIEVVSETNDDIELAPQVPQADEIKIDTEEGEGLGSLEGEAKWDDLDKEDEDDPSMVSEYVQEIFKYLLKLEQESMPSPTYMDTQEELSWKMRGILTDWLIQIHARFRLLPETLFLTINIIDRFLSQRVVSVYKLQLMGVTALFIAAKYEEIMAPSVQNFLHSADGTYGEKDILDAEKYILRTIDWNLSYPNPIHFLRRASKADGYDLAARTVAKYFIEITLLDHRFLEAPPSLAAAAGLWLARLVVDKDDWTPNLIHYSGYTEAEIIPVARLMLNYILKPTRHHNFFKKYAAKKFMKTSTFVHNWARERWQEGSMVDLLEELPELRRIAQERREAGIATYMTAEETGALFV